MLRTTSVLPEQKKLLGIVIYHAYKKYSYNIKKEEISRTSNTNSISIMSLIVSNPGVKRPVGGRTIFK